MVRPANLVHVQAPLTGLLVAFHHACPKGEAAKRRELAFFQEEYTKLGTIINIRCTTHEMPMFVRGVKSMAARLAPVDPALKARMLGNLTVDKCVRVCVPSGMAQCSYRCVHACHWLPACIVPASAPG